MQSVPYHHVEYEWWLSDFRWMRLLRLQSKTTVVAWKKEWLSQRILETRAEMKRHAIDMYSPLTPLERQMEKWKDHPSVR